MKYLNKIGINAKNAFNKFNNIKHSKIIKVLNDFNTMIKKNQSLIIKENLKDVRNVKRKHLIDRLILNKNRIDGIRNSINEIMKFKDNLYYLTGTNVSYWYNRSNI